MSYNQEATPQHQLYKLQRVLVARELLLVQALQALQAQTEYIQLIPLHLIRTGAVTLFFKGADFNGIAKCLRVFLTESISDLYKVIFAVSCNSFLKIKAKR